MTIDDANKTRPTGLSAVLNQQRSAIARMGIRALTSVDLSILYEETLELLSTTLPSDLCLILEYDPIPASLRVGAADGLKDSAGEIAPGLEVLLDGESLILEDMRDDPRFKDTRLVRELGMISGLSTTIPGATHPYGVLAVYSSLQHSYSNYDANFLQSIANLLTAAIHRSQTEEDLRSLNENLESLVIARTRLVNLLQEVTVAANEAATIPEAMRTTLDLIRAYTGWPIGHVYYRNNQADDELIPTSIWSCDDPESFKEFIQETAETTLSAGRGLPGRVLASGRPEFVFDLTQAKFLRSNVGETSGFKSGFAFPVLVGKDIMAVMEFYTRRSIHLDSALVEASTNIGIQLGRVVERRRAEEKLRASEIRFRTIFEGSAVGISIVDLDRRFLVANPAFKEMSGYDGNDLVDMELDSLVLPQELGSVLPRYQTVFSGDANHIRLEHRLLHKTGKNMWVNTTITLIRKEDGLPRFAILMIEDITPRKLVEAELSEVKKRLIAGRERERLYLAQELHDEPLQELYGVLYQLEDLMNYTQHDERLRGIHEAQSAVNRIINTLRSICVELRPPTLAHFGLEGAIRELADRYRSEHLETQLRLELMQDGTLLSEQVRLTFYRILQQALSNVYRHSQASKVSIRFKIAQDLAILEVEDNGKGFSVPSRWVSFVREGHLGLAGAAERAEVVNGAFQVISTPDKGTLVRVSIPREAGEKDSVSADFSV